MRQLVAADWDEVRPARQYVGGLMDRVGEHQARDGTRAGRRDLLLDRGIAPDLGDADQAEERNQELVERLHLAVGKDDRPGRVYSDRQVVGHEAVDAVANVGRRGAVGNGLVVGDEDEQFDARIL
jgi:hypothetical protein